jgi:uncharacterized protein YdhG (YjbR/CyaY superfamily)
MMAKTDFTSVDEYIAAHTEDVQSILSCVRNTIRNAVPGAEETIAYQIPAYKLQGGAVLYFAGWKQHYSLYPASDRLVRAFKNELAPYKISKGTIRFRLSKEGDARQREARSVQEALAGVTTPRRRPSGWSNSRGR